MRGISIIKVLNKNKHESKKNRQNKTKTIRWYEIILIRSEVGKQN